MPIYIKPVPGKSVPDPERGGLVPASGRNVERTQYWIARLVAGDIEECDPPADQDCAQPQPDPTPAPKPADQPQE